MAACCKPVILVAVFLFSTVVAIRVKNHQLPTVINQSNGDTERYDAIGADSLSIKVVGKEERSDRPPAPLAAGDEESDGTGGELVNARETRPMQAAVFLKEGAMEEEGEEEPMLLRNITGKDGSRESEDAEGGAESGLRRRPALFASGAKWLSWVERDGSQKSDDAEGAAESRLRRRSALTASGAKAAEEAWLQRRRSAESESSSRWRVDAATLAVLEEAFALDAYAVGERANLLAIELGASTHQIKTWFRNRRDRVKKARLASQGRGWRVNAATLAALEEAFALDAYAVGERANRLAIELGASTHQIKTWFRNRRDRVKKARLASQSSHAPLVAASHSKWKVPVVAWKVPAGTRKAQAGEAARGKRQANADAPMTVWPKRRKEQSSPRMKRRNNEQMSMASSHMLAFMSDSLLPKQSLSPDGGDASPNRHRGSPPHNSSSARSLRPWSKQGYEEVQREIDFLLSIDPDYVPLQLHDLQRPVVQQMGTEGWFTPLLENHASAVLENQVGQMGREGLVSMDELENHASPVLESHDLQLPAVEQMGREGWVSMDELENHASGALESHDLQLPSAEQDGFRRMVQHGRFASVALESHDLQVPSAEQDGFRRMVQQGWFPSAALESHDLQLAAAEQIQTETWFSTVKQALRSEIADLRCLCNALDEPRCCEEQNCCK